VSLNCILSDQLSGKSLREMKAIWYLLRCPEGSETDYTEKCPKLVRSDSLKEIVCFRYQRMMRYGGKWHLENRTLLPGCIFLFGTKAMELKKGCKEDEEKFSVSLIPCEVPYMKEMCQEGGLIGISKGIIKNGSPIVTSGPLKGREELIRKIDRHKRTAKIEIPFGRDKKRVTVGLEIYEKQM